MSDDPIPLTSTVIVPPFPVDALPTTIAAMVKALANATQTDPAMAGTSALTVLSMCNGGNAVVQIRPGWEEPLNLFTATVAYPGERKSAVQRAMVQPVRDTERKLVADGKKERTEKQAEREVAAKMVDKYRVNATKDDASKNAMTELAQAIDMMEAITVPPSLRLIADDVTPEAAASLIAEQGGRLAIISTEGNIFDILAGRYSGTVNLDLFLKGHCGDELIVDRKGRGAERVSECVANPALTVGLMVQPNVLDAIAQNHVFRGRGLLARFLYSWPKSKVGHRVIAPTPVTDEIRNAYESAISDLATKMVKWQSDTAKLTLTDKAQEAIVTIEYAVESTLAGSGELASLADWGGKYVGAIARIAGNFHLAGLGGDEGPRTPIDAETVWNAHRIGKYFKASAINAFTEMGVSDTIADARYLLDRIHATGQKELSERDMQRAAKARFPTKAGLLGPLSTLVDYGWLTRLEDPDKPTGGRPASPRYRVAPRTKGTEGTEPR